MPISAAAVLPHPPLLLPELGRGDAAELEALRSACRRAVEAIVAEADALLLVGAGPLPALAAPGATASFAPFGAPVTVSLPGTAAGKSGRGGGAAAPATAGRGKGRGGAAAASATAGRGKGRGGAATAPVTAGRGKGRGGAATAPAAADKQHGRDGGATALAAADRETGRDGGASAREPAVAAAPDGRLDLERLAEALPGVPWRDLRGELPLSLAVGAWLLDQTGLAVPRLAAVAVPPMVSGARAAALGRALALAGGPGERVGLLAMGDLSARRTPAAPGSFHPDAAGFDRQVGRAIRDGAPGRLLDLDPALAATVQAAGLGPLQVLAGALESAAPLRAEILYEDAPYGVGYLVAVLRRS